MLEYLAKLELSPKHQSVRWSSSGSQTFKTPFRIVPATLMLAFLE
jgi:hypothetical protein